MSDNFENMMFGELDDMIRKAQEGDSDSADRLSSYLSYFAKTDEWKQLPVQYCMKKDRSGYKPASWLRSIHL